MKWLRTLAAVLVVVASAAAAWHLVIPRLRCNRDKAIVNTWTIRLNRQGVDSQSVMKARELAEMCRRCLELFPNDYEFELLLGSNESFVGDHERAEQTFLRSLALNERPETYAYLALTQLDEGKVDEARKNLYLGALFNLTVVELISDPLQSEIAQAVTERHKRLGSRDPLKRKHIRRSETDRTLPNQ
jgi:tetratricopeptide (TPR) repeat protein